MTCKFEKQEVAYKLVLASLAGTEILDKMAAEDRTVEDYMEDILKQTTFSSIEMDIIEEHFRHGIQTGDLIEMAGTYKGKNFSMKTYYKSEVTEIEGDFNDEEKEEIEFLAWGGDNMYYFLGTLDQIYREQHPDTPKLYHCTNH